MAWLKSLLNIWQWAHFDKQTYIFSILSRAHNFIEGNCIRSEVTDSIGPIASITELTVEPRRNPRESQESGILALAFLPPAHYTLFFLHIWIQIQ